MTRSTESMSNQIHLLLERCRKFIDAPAFRVNLKLNNYEIQNDKTQLIISIVKIAVSNAMAHASANQVMIDLRSRERTIEVSIEDDGIGFDITRNFGQGLQQLHDLVEQAKGHLEISTDVGAGTEVTAEIPVR